MAQGKVDYGYMQKEPCHSVGMQGATFMLCNKRGPAVAVS